MKIKFDLEQEKEFRVYHGYKYWSERGRFHRLTGPAVEHPGGSKVWWEDNRSIKTINAKPTKR